MAQQTHPHPELTIVVPVRNESAYILDVLGQIYAQDLDPERFEVLVVDGFSEDGTRDLVREFARNHPQVYLLDNPQFISGCARNVGVHHAAAPYILFIDGHCRLESPHLLSASLDAFQRGERCLSRPQPLTTEGVTPFQAAVALARSSCLGHQVGSNIFEADDYHCNPLSAGCGYDLALYRELGGVDENFDAGEDLEFNLRVHQYGIEALHSLQFTISYIPRGSWRALFRQLYRYGCGRARMARKHPRTTSPLAILLGLMSLWLLILLPVGLAWKPAVLLWAITAGAYTAGILGLAAWQARGRGLAMWLRVASCFPAIHVGAGLGYLSGLVGGPSWRHTPSRADRQRIAAESAQRARDASGTTGPSHDTIA